MGPREKLFAQGRASLCDAELLAILIRTGTRNETGLQIASRMLVEQNGLTGIARLEPGWLVRQYPGVGMAKAATISAGFEAGLRSAIPPRALPCLEARSAASLLLPKLGHLVQEEFHVLYLNARKELIRQHMVSRGSLTRTVVHPSDVFRPAIATGAECVVLAHNHPSGDPTPSLADRQTTQRLCCAGRHLGIEVLDHLVIAGSKWNSIRDSDSDLFI